jgi:hypothetical protein
MVMQTRLTAGLKILGVYFLVQGTAQFLGFAITLASVLAEPYSSFPFWKVLTNGLFYGIVQFLAAFFCLRKTDLLARFCRGSNAKAQA